MSIPSITCPNGENPWLSKKALPCSLVLMKIWVVRELGPAVAKTTVPRVLDTLTGSSGILFDRHLLWMAGFPLIPNCAMKPGRTLKILQSSKNFSSTNSCFFIRKYPTLEPIRKFLYLDSKRTIIHTSNRRTPRGAHSGRSWILIVPMLLPCVAGLKLATCNSTIRPVVGVDRSSANAIDGPFRKTANVAAPNIACRSLRKTSRRFVGVSLSAVVVDNPVCRRRWWWWPFTLKQDACKTKHATTRIPESIETRPLMIKVLL